MVIARVCIGKLCAGSYVGLGDGENQVLGWGRGECQVLGAKVSANWVRSRSSWVRGCGWGNCVRDCMLANRGDADQVLQGGSEYQVLGKEVSAS